MTLLAPARLAAAQEAAPRWNSKFSIDGVLGWGTPVGFAGLYAELAPVNWLAISCGLGAGPHGPEEALMARVRTGSERVRIGLGVGVSVGPYAAQSPPFALFAHQWNEYRWDFATWLNTELSVEGRSAGGFEVRGFFGVGLLGNGASSCLTRDPESGAAPSVTTCAPNDTATGLFVSTLPYLGVALGHWFGG